MQLPPLASRDRRNRLSPSCAYHGSCDLALPCTATDHRDHTGVDAFAKPLSNERSQATGADRRRTTCGDLAGCLVFGAEVTYACVMGFGYELTSNHT
jgi:hypothetical protein